MIWLAFLAATAGAVSDPMMFGGPASSLGKLAEAARKCGYNEAAVTKAFFGATVVALPMASFSDHRLNCVMEWFLAHPKLELGFIGNKAIRP
ncbi:hypothetical protein HL653_14685 [Sphingomonas sp. AP4-R1]|uniref:hypothetical protein n=1 Tax=Sphingomonas sp. AP4-R1 TaxID=2735134 RepID=UPI001493691E|nr:hypothetical protein [Sphingomonas sp. AP4-R1]QJU58849.1 hypothetical protein HL653_14685 [Sphingomonas sp. AP4-R1]